MLLGSAVAFLLVLAAAPAETNAALTATESAQLAANMARGDLLYAYDQSAWHVTDSAMAALPKETRAKLRGYISTPAAGGIRTTFFSQSGQDYLAAYSATWSGSAITDVKIYGAAERIPVSPEERRLIDARSLVLANAGTLNMCSSASPNAVVLPGPDGSISVYVLTPQTTPERVPLGGHHRFDVKDGKIASRRSFTRTCIDLHAKGGTPVANAVSHLLDPVPTEIHAFAVHATGLPLGVAARAGIFYLTLKNGRAAAEFVGRQ